MIYGRQLCVDVEQLGHISATNKHHRLVLPSLTVRGGKTHEFDSSLPNHCSPANSIFFSTHAAPPYHCERIPSPPTSLASALLTGNVNFSVFISIWLDATRPAVVGPGVNEGDSCFVELGADILFNFVDEDGSHIDLTERLTSTEDRQ